MFDLITQEEIYNGSMELAQLNVSDLPYVPTELDWADYERHLDGQDLDNANRELLEV